MTPEGWEQAPARTDGADENDCAGCPPPQDGQSRGPGGPGIPGSPGGSRGPGGPAGTAGPGGSIGTPGVRSGYTRQGRQQAARQADRVVVVEMVQYVPVAGEPTVVDTRYGRWLVEQEQPWVRKVTVGPEWKALDVGWIKQSSLLVVVNEGAPRPATRPTPEEARAAADLVLEVGLRWPGGPGTLQDPRQRTMHDPPRQDPLVVPLFRLLPGESLRGSAVQPDWWMLRCLTGTTRCVVYLFPV